MRAGIVHYNTEDGGRPAPGRARRARVKLLLLGGPRFLGRAVADAALERGHELTFFNRGRTNPELYPEVGEARRGPRRRARAARGPDVGRRDRHERLRPARRPRVGGGARRLRAATASCRASPSTRTSASRSTRRAPSPSSATAPIDELTPDFSNYGALKALCEDAVSDVFGGRALNVRPGLIVGPHDPTGPLHVLAAPRRARRRGARRRTARAPDPVRGRPRPRRVAGRALRARRRPGRSTRRTRASAGASSSRPAARSTDAEAEITWVSEELPARERGRPVDGAAALARRTGDGVRRSRGRLARGRRGALGSGRSRTRFARRSSTRRRRMRPASPPSARPSCWSSGMPDKDYSGTPLSRKLGAKPGAGVVVFFTTTRADLERRFELLKGALDPADGLWIAWPKKAAKIDGRSRLRGGAGDRARPRARGQQVVLDRRELAGAAVRLPARGSLAVRLAGPVPGLLVPADEIRVDAARIGEVDGEPLEADDVDDGMPAREELGLAPDLSERAHDVTPHAPQRGPRPRARGSEPTGRSRRGARAGAARCGAPPPRRARLRGA